MSKNRSAFRQGVTTGLALVLALVVGLFLGMALLDSSSAQGPSPMKVNGSDVARSPDFDLARGFAEVAEKVGPAVVNINTQVIIRPRQQEGQQIPEQLRRFFGDEFSQRFFGPMEPQERHSLGSGVIVDPSGYVLTNHHVVAPLETRGVRQIADEISVKISEGESYRAEVVGVDPESDLAVLKIDAGEPLPFAAIGESSGLQVGDWVVAVGSPFGLDHTVTAGIISATERFVPTGIFGNYIQTDAAINPGNSGGPLLNLSGQVVGVNTFIASTSGSFAGVGFAVPSSVFVRSYNQLITDGYIKRGWLGVSMNNRPMTPELAEFFGIAGDDPSGLKDGDGVIVTQLINKEGNVANTGPAAKAGIQEGDVIVRFNGKEIESGLDLRSAVATTDPDKKVDVTVIRDGKPIVMNVQLGTRTLEQQQRAQAEGLSLDEQENEEPKEIGLEFRTLSSQDAGRIGMEDETGVLILGVTPGSLAADAGLSEQQVITHVNGKTVSSAQEFKSRVDDIPSGEGVILRVLVPAQNQETGAFYTSFVKP